jgi:hypothetical protein
MGRERGRLGKEAGLGRRAAVLGPGRGELRSLMSCMRGIVKRICLLF